jgi:hypothetical protein
MIDKLKIEKMIIYNVTVKIENQSHNEWLDWMLNKHIPDVLSTGMFKEYRMSKIMVDDEDGTNYSIQYLCANAEDLESYQRQHAPALQREHAERYKDRFVAFRTIMHVVGHNTKVD